MEGKPMRPLSDEIMGNEDLMALLAETEPEPEPEPMEEDLADAPISIIERRNLIQFHMRSDVFSTQAVWVEATRGFHLNWKAENLNKFEGDE